MIEADRAAEAAEAIKSLAPPGSDKQSFFTRVK
jgi:hypothetical protein